MLDLHLRKKKIARICFDYAVTLITEESDELRLESEFTYQGSDGSRVLVSPTRLGERHALVAVFGETILSAVSAEDGSLEVRLGDGASISADPDMRYESWNLACSDGFKVVCNPRGGLTSWDPLT